jgi:hypothetical protein
VLTVNGKAELVVQDAAAYQKLLELVEQMETVQILRERLAAARRGEGRPVEEFEAAMDELAEGLDHVPVLAPEALSRESIYGRRA